jgi:hypothetical protein
MLYLAADNPYSCSMPEQPFSLFSLLRIARFSVPTAILTNLDKEQK